MRVLALLFALVAVPRTADACSCVALSPRQLYDQAEAVLVGDVLEVSEAPRQKAVRVRVTRAYKGTMKAGETVVVTLPGGSSASCSLDLTHGGRVVVFGRAAEGGIATNLCQGSYPLEPGKPLPELPPPA
jgi:translation elongation factor EF-G